MLSSNKYWLNQSKWTFSTKITGGVRYVYPRVDEWVTQRTFYTSKQLDLFLNGTTADRPFSAFIQILRYAYGNIWLAATFGEFITAYYTFKVFLSSTDKAMGDQIGSLVETLATYRTFNLSLSSMDDKMLV